MTHDSLAHGRLLTDIPAEHIVPQGSHQRDRIFFVVLFVEQGHLVKQPHRIFRMIHFDDDGRLDHGFQIPDPAVVPVPFPLGGTVFVIFAQVTQFSCPPHFVPQLWVQLFPAPPDLVFHFLYIHFGQFVVHSVYSFSSQYCIQYTIYIRRHQV